MNKVSAKVGLIQQAFISIHSITIVRDSELADEPLSRMSARATPASYNGDALSIGGTTPPITVCLELESVLKGVRLDF